MGKSFCLFAIWTVFAVSAADYKPESYAYTLRNIGQGTNESILVQVDCPVTTPARAADDAAEYAVHGVIFSGCPAAQTTPEQPPLVRSERLTAEQTAWFDTFFAKGRYKQYVVSVVRGSIQITKIKKRYTAKVTVAIDKRKLRKELENAGIIERLGAVFEK